MVRAVVPRPAVLRRLALRRVVGCWVVAAVLLAAGCMPAGGPPGRGGGPARKGEGPGGRPQRLALTPEQELEVGERAYRKVLAEYRGRILPADSPEVRQARQISQRIVKAAQIRPLQKEINLHLNRDRYAWDVSVVKDDRVNAFCLPAGKIVVFTGIVRFTKGNDDELATVLSHEISHALAHHASERIAREKGGAESIFRKLSFERAQESEADHIGVFLMTFAGYDPRAAVRFWMKMARLSKSRRPEFLSDHPSDARRVRALQKWAYDAQRAKRAYDRGNVVQ
jgi:predicted Zn-dependent protease